jgi:hypothetical protein
MCNQLTHEAFVVLERDHALVFVARDGLREFDALLDQSLNPESNGARPDREGRYSYLPATLPASSSIRPGEKGKDTTRVSPLITEVEVIVRGIVEVYRALNEPEAENAGVEVEIPLRVTGDTSDVMNSGSAETHRPDSCLCFLRDLALIGARAGTPAFSAITALMLMRV